MAKIISYQPNQWPDVKSGSENQQIQSRNTRSRRPTQFVSICWFGWKEETPPVTKLRKLASHRTPFEEAFIWMKLAIRGLKPGIWEAIAANSSSADAICNMGIIYAGKGETAKPSAPLPKPSACNPGIWRPITIWLMSISTRTITTSLSYIMKLPWRLIREFSDAWFNLTIAFLRPRCIRKRWMPICNTGSWCLRNKRIFWVVT